MHAERDAPTARGRPGGRRRLWLATVAVVLVAVAGGVGVVLSRTTPAGPEPVVLPTPTPSVSPVDRDRTTAFQQSLPDTVLAFAVGSTAAPVADVDRGALEAYELEYTDGAVQLTLVATQWRTAEDAQRAMSALVEVDGAEPAPTGMRPTGPSPLPTGSASVPPATAAPYREGTVVVGGRAAGRVVIVGDGARARAVWTNETALFVLEGPVDVVGPFYDAFPM